MGASERNRVGQEDSKIFDFQCLGGVHVVVVLVWLYSGIIQIPRPHLWSVHLEQQASMRLPLRDYRGLHLAEDDIDCSCFTVNVGGVHPICFSRSIIPIKVVMAGATVVSHIEKTSTMKSVNHRT